MKIQSTFRGYRTRKRLEDARQASKFIDDDSFDNYDLSETYFEDLAYLCADQKSRPLVQNGDANVSKENPNHERLQLLDPGVQGSPAHEIDVELSHDVPHTSSEFNNVSTSKIPQETEAVMDCNAYPKPQENYTSLECR